MHPKGSTVNRVFTDDSEIVVKMITDILGDERIDTIVREIISKMKLDE